MPFYTVKIYERGKSKGSSCHSADNRQSAIVIANEWARIRGWEPDKWVVYRNADTTNAGRYKRSCGKYIRVD